MLNCTLVGAPVECGASQFGCLMGPDAYRAAGLKPTIEALGYDVHDLGNISPRQMKSVGYPNPSIHHLNETIDWAVSLEDVAYKAAKSSNLPIFLGGDHSLSNGTVPGVTRHAAERGSEQFVLWLDAHPDIHTLKTTTSGYLHGTPVAYFTGQTDFDGVYPALQHSVDPSNVCMMGIRSVDPSENRHLSNSNIAVHDMHSIDEHGVAAPLRSFLGRVRKANGVLYVSLDVDFLEPNITPAVGTTARGGATFREAYLIMEMLCDSGVVTSLDLVELNPFLDERGRTAKLMVDLCASLPGRKVLDRPTRSF